MKNILSYSILLALFILSSCKKKDSPVVENPAVVNSPADSTPTSCFHTNKDHYKKMETVQFDNCSVNFDRTEWYFGDGGASTFSEPEYKYASAGVYNIRLKTFKGVSSIEASQKIWVADTIRVNYTLNWESTTAKQSDLIKVYIYYRKDGETAFKSTNANAYEYNKSFWGGSANVSQSGFVDIPNPSKALQLKIVSACYTFTGSTTLPDVLTAKDSILTAEFDGFTGLKEPEVSNEMSLGKLNQKYSMLYR